MALDIGQRLAVACIGQQVQVGDLGIGAGDQMVDKIAADKAGASGYEYAGGYVLPVLVRIHGAVF
jgi:hypothetical protein